MSYYGVNARLDVALAYHVCLELNPIIDMIRHLKEEAFSKTRVLGLPGRATEVSGWRELTSIEPSAGFIFSYLLLSKGYSSTQGVAVGGSDQSTASICSIFHQFIMGILRVTAFEKSTLVLFCNKRRERPSSFYFLGLAC
jgi:hypothetical protein